MNYQQAVLLSIMAALISSCGGLKQSNERYAYNQDRAPLIKPENILETPNAIPINEPKSRGGNPPSYTVFGKTYYVLNNNKGFTQQGIASWYGAKFHGHKTSNGETYDMYAMSAAHKSLPLPSYLEVTNLANGKKVVVRVNDRGPFHGNRIIDLSFAAAAKLGVLNSGTATVAIRALNPTATADNTAKDQLLQPQRLATQEQQNAAMLYIQAGAFTQQANALLLKRKLALSNTLAPEIHQKKSGHQTLYLVRTGPYPSLKHAARELLELQKSGVVNGHYIYQ